MNIEFQKITRRDKKTFLSDKGNPLHGPRVLRPAMGWSRSPQQHLFFLPKPFLMIVQKGTLGTPLPQARHALGVLDFQVY